MKYLSIIVFSITCFLSNLADAQTVVYKTVNKDGSVSYSDTPSPGAIKVVLGANSTIIPAAKTPPPPSPKAKRQQKQFTLNILSPENEATIRNNMGNITIQAQVEPQAPGLFMLSINGQTIQSPTGIFKLENMDRGEYTYKVSLVNNSGKVIASSEERKLFLHQASVLIRQN